MKNISSEENQKNYEKGLLCDLPIPPDTKTGWPWTEEVNPGIYKSLKTFPKISILTPSYNQGEFIEQTIRSVLLQNYPSLEFIIIDGGSSDNTKEIIKKYEPWIKFWVSEKDNGQSHAINKGVEHCTGEIFNWINSDDYYYEECFKILAESFTDNINVVAGKYRFFDESGATEDRLINLKLRNSLEESISHVLINQPSTFFRLESFRNLGKLDEKLHFVMDQDIWKKYLFKYGQKNIKIIDKELSHFRLHSKSKTSQFQFNNEYTGIIYSIALKAGMKQHAGFIKRIYDYKNTNDYSFNYNFNDEDIMLARKVVNYFLYFKARIAYTDKNYELLNEYLNVIELRFIKDHDTNEVRKLKIKSILIKYRLSFLLNIFGKKD